MVDQLQKKKLWFLRTEAKSVLQHSLCVVTPCCLTVGTDVPSNVAPEHSGNKSFLNSGNYPSDYNHLKC